MEQAHVTIQKADLAQPVKISKHLYGHFAEHLGGCIYGGLWVGEDSDIPNTRGIRNDVVAALRELSIPNLRWPGGCFADEYHWRDGIGPRETRPRTINSHWGGVVESNAFGTHEFLDLCELLDCEPYIAGNVGSGTPRELKEWVQYLTYDGDTDLTRLRKANGRDEPWNIRFFGVGNENWGCGGAMRPEYYADLYRQYASFARNYSGNELYRIACGPNGRDYKWTEVLMKQAGHHMAGIALHYYTVGDWNHKGSATAFDDAEYLETLLRANRMDEIIQGHRDVMDRHDPNHRVALIVDEWGTWFDVEPGTNPGFLFQQNTMRDALVTGLTLNIFHNHAERVRMANLAQLVNVLQSPILTDGPRMVLTPTYHVLKMYRVHQDATRLPLSVQSPDYGGSTDRLQQLSVSGSRNDSGIVHLSLCNLHHEKPLEVSCDFHGLPMASVTGQHLTGDSIRAMNTSDNGSCVSPELAEDLHMEGSRLSLCLPPHSVSVLAIQPV